jgi:hypothetical protein
MISIQKKIIFVQLFQFFISVTADKSCEFGGDFSENEHSEYLLWTNNLPVLKDQERQGKH